MITYRRITDKNADFIKEMLYQMVFFSDESKKPSKAELLSVPEIIRYYDRLAGSGEGIIAEECGVPAGAAWFTIFSKTDRGYGFVDENTPEISIAVDKASRGRGIGSGLLSELLELAKARGFESISLSVDADNPAVRLYERAGFRKIRKEATSWVMIKELA
jgi:GNAT superfamily N-acetyltransferase